MKQRYQMKDLDCAHCAAKMEDAIGKIDGVQKVSVNFLTQRLTLEAEEDRFDTILQEAAAICRKVDPDCRILL